MTTNFQDDEEIVATEREHVWRLVEQAISSEIDGTLRAVTRNALMHELTSASVSANSRLDSKFGRWAIRRSDLDIIARVTDGLLATAPAAYVTHDLRLQVLGAAIVATFRSAKNLRRMGVTLQHDEVTAISYLHTQKDGATREQLADRLLIAGAIQEVAEVDDVIRRLSAMATKGGAVVALIEQAGTGRFVSQT